MKPSAAAIAGGGSAAAVLAISAVEAGDWLTLVERIVASPAGLLVFCMLVLIGLAYLLARQWHAGAACEERIEQLMRAMSSMYALLATDDRYPDLPSFDEFVERGLDLRAMHKARNAQPAAFSRPSGGRP